MIKPIKLPFKDNKVNFDESISHGLFLLVGLQGSGKTAFATRLILNEHNNRPIFTNYNLYGIPFIKITLGNEKAEKSGSIDILKTIKKNPSFFDNSVMVLDEIHVYFNSKNYFKDRQRELDQFFSQLRKRNILLIATTQRFMSVNISVRSQARFLMELEKVVFEPRTKRRDNDTLFKVSTYRQEQGYYYPQQVAKPVIFDLKPYFRYYNTLEVIT